MTTTYRPTKGDTADRIIAGIAAMLPDSGDGRPFTHRAGPAGRMSGAMCHDITEARRAAAEHNRTRALMIQRGALTAAAPRWIAERLPEPRA